MKISLFSFYDNKESWLNDVIAIYEKKISHFCQFDFTAIKPPKISRNQKNEKISKEETLLIKKLREEDYLVLLDEKGSSYDSLNFSDYITEKQEQIGNRRLVFVIGGAFGVSDAIKQRAQDKLKISPFVLSHHIAIPVIMEQVYRAFTIKSGIPYHNS